MILRRPRGAALVPHRHTSRRLRNRAGVSLVEILVASLVLSVGLLGVVGTSRNIADQMGGGIRQTVASNIAQARMDSLASISCSALAAVSTGTATTRGIKESWTVTDGVNIKTIAVVVTVPRRTKTLKFSTVIPCKD